MFSPVDYQDLEASRALKRQTTNPDGNCQRIRRLYQLSHERHEVEKGKKSYPSIKMPIKLR